MTEEDKQLFLSTMRALEMLYYRNVALETMLDKFPPPRPDWKEIVDKLAEDQRVQPLVRETFRRVIADLEQSPPDDVSPSTAIAHLLQALPVRGKPN